MGDSVGSATAPRLPSADRSVGERPLFAIGLILLSNMLFSAMDTISKFLAAGYSPIEIIWGRHLFIAALLLPFLFGSRRRFLRSARPGLQVARGVCIIASSVLFVTALVTLPMAEAIAISFITPLLVTGLSILFLAEKVGIRRWSAIAAGFIGILIVIQPGSAAFDPAAGFPLLASLCWAIGLIIIRRMGASDPPLTTVIYSTVVGLVLTTALLPWVWVPPSPDAWALLALMGGLGIVGHYILVLAYLRASISLLAPFTYSQMLSSTAAGYLVFGAIPDLATWIGGGIVTASGLYTLHRERLRRAPAIR